MSGWAQIDGRMWRGAIVVIASMCAAVVASGARAQDDADIAGDIAGDMKDAIVGTWVGKGNHAGNEDQFNMNLTFVSPKGGTSRYPDIPCGGMLVGDQKGNRYEYKETVTFNGPEEKVENFCINGSMSVSIEGDTMKYEWSSQYNGQDYSATGELKRQKGGKKR